MATPAAPDAPELALDVPWGDSTGREIVFLVDASTRIELGIIEDWIARHAPGSETDSAQRLVRVPRGAVLPSDSELARMLESALACGGDPLLAPVRVLWQPRWRNGGRSASFLDLVTFNNPRNPGILHQMWNARRVPDTYRVIVGEPAPVGELVENWRHSVGSSADQTQGFADFVARRAQLALERAERRVIGARYKLPHFVREEIEEKRSYRLGLSRLATRLGRPEPSVVEEGRRDLKEIAAGATRRSVDMQAALYRQIYKHAYGDTQNYDPDALERIREAEREYPVVFLSSHRSYIDPFFLRAALHDHGLPPNHVAAGANLNFFPLGPLLRRAGFFFIRRSFKDDEVYKFVLDQYIAYLVEKRFSLEWYIEGGRSRLGKLLPPRYGMLNMVVDAYLAGYTDDVLCVPVSIVYDQMGEVSSYAREATGATKKGEGIGFMLRYMRSLIKGSFGEVSLGFGEPVSMREMLGPPGDGTETHSDRKLGVQKLAFETMVRINGVTPVTATSLVTMAMLGRGDKALTAGQLVERLHDYLEFVARRAIPTTGNFDLTSTDGVRCALDLMMDNDVVTCYADGPDAVYEISENQFIQAAYYRNAVIHFFLNSAIVETSLIAAADASGSRVEVFMNSSMALRDLMKFEFFFEDKDKYRDDVLDELEMHDPEWRATIEAGPEAIYQLLQEFRPFTAQTVLRSFVEAYQVVADALDSAGSASIGDEKAFLRACLPRGRQYLLQRRILSAESISMVLFANALRLARNRGLCDTGDPDLAKRRSEFAAELDDVARRIRQIAGLAAARRAVFR